MLMHKCGRDFALRAIDNTDACVPARVVSKLGVAQPPAALVDAYLREIARGYHVEWAPPGGSDSDDDEGGGGLKEPAEGEASKEGETEEGKQPERAPRTR